MDTEYPIVPQPENFRRSLFDHQKTSIHEMEKLEKERVININSVYNLETNFGIQSDPTGYGKTASMVGLIVRDSMSWDLETPEVIEEPYSINHGCKITKKFTLRRIPTNLIVISQSLVSQWKDEFTRTDLKVEVVRTRKKAGSVKVEDFDVILSTPTMYNKLLERYIGVAWKRMIYDEPGTTTIPSMKRIYTGFTWFVTATPKLLKWKYSSRRNHHIARLCLHYMENIFFKALQIKNDEDYVRNSYSMPAVNHHFYQCHQPISRAVMGFVPRRVEIMIAAGNIRGAIRYLGGAETDNIVDLVKNRFTEELEEAIHKIHRYTTRGDQERITEWTEKKARIENKIRDLEERYKESLDGNCNICWSQLNKPALVSCCNNLFCGACIMNWLTRQNTCPLCRQSLTISDLTYITEETTENVEEDTKITKPQQIVKIIKDNKDGKFIIFSDEDATYTCLTSELDKENIVCKEIKGRSESREKLIKEFKSGKSRVIFLNSRNNGAGINLQECTDIILYHQMENSTTTQMLGRANRIGRTEELNVHHLQVC